MYIIDVLQVEGWQFRYFIRYLIHHFYKQKNVVLLLFSICGDKNSQIQEHLDKIRPRTFDVGELESWLNRCNNGHRQYSTRDDLLALPSGSRLIDVKRGCIITAKSDPIYCALSYVWGGENQLTLNKQNLTRLEKEGALFGNDFLLPKSIRR